MFARHYGARPAGFAIFPVWTIENDWIAGEIAEDYHRHRREHPQHVIRYLCNTPEETELLLARGVPALFLNHKFTVSERVFRPIEDLPPDFDAIYNARFVPIKRHELAALVPSLALITYVEPPEARKDDFRRLWPLAAARAPQHVLLNRMEDGLPMRMSHEEVNSALNRAYVGLLLSEVEGASYAAMEYMLAGLPVVSTPSIGGRHVFFDPDYCIVCDPAPEAVRDAVADLKARRLPREFVRERTLAKIEPERRRFLALLNEMLAELGAAPQFGTEWPIQQGSGVPWSSFENHFRRFEQLSAGSAGS